MKYVKFIFVLFIFIFTTTSINSYSIENKKYIYLTFDDGPTLKNTPELLDELKKLDLPATFFVVGKLINENPTVLSRIIEENHSIGLHTMSHNKNKCYASQENFIKENIELQNLLKDKFNFTTNLLRFPFGSQNSYLKMTDIFANKLHGNNFKIYDWHIDTYDAIHPENDAETILNICKNQYTKRYADKDNIIILMHTNSNNKKTIQSLKLIKEFFSNLGYEFASITDNTPEYYYKKSN